MCKQPTKTTVLFITSTSHKCKLTLQVQFDFQCFRLFGFVLFCFYPKQYRFAFSKSIYFKFYHTPYKGCACNCLQIMLDTPLLSVLLENTNNLYLYSTHSTVTEVYCIRQFNLKIEQLNPEIFISCPSALVKMRNTLRYFDKLHQL